MLSITQELQVERALEAVRNGGVILYPTDTIWGLGCDATQPGAIHKLNSIKQRDTGKPYILLMSGSRQLRKYLANPVPDLDEFIDQFIEPTTIIYPNAVNLPDEVLAEDGSVAVRIVQHPFCLAVLHRLKHPLISTSANLSGQVAPVRRVDIVPELLKDLDYCVEWEDGEKQAPSSIFRLLDSGELESIR